MSRFACLLSASLLVSAASAQTSFTLRVSPKVVLADGDKMVVPMELTNTGKAPLAFGASSQNQKWGLAGLTVPPGRPVGLALSTFHVSPQASKTIPAGHLFNTGPSFGLHLAGGMIVHVNCNPPSNRSTYIRVPVAFGTAAMTSAPTLALPASVYEVARGPRNPGEICWGVSWVPGLRHSNLLNHRVGASRASLVLCGELKSGRSFVINVFGRTGENYVALWALGTGSIPSPWGKIRLDLTTTVPFLVGGIAPNGAGRTWITVPPKVPSGVRLYVQALVFSSSGSNLELTNLAEIVSS